MSFGKYFGQNVNLYSQGYLKPKFRHNCLCIRSKYCVSILRDALYIVSSFGHNNSLSTFLTIEVYSNVINKCV